MDSKIGLTLVTTVINTHNPCQFILSIGDMVITAGYKDYDDSNVIGYTQLYGLRFVLGDNIMSSLLFQDAFAPSKFTVVGESTSAENEWAVVFLGLNLTVPESNPSSPFHLRTTCSTHSNRVSQIHYVKAKLRRIGTVTNMKSFINTVIPAAAAGPIKAFEVAPRPRIILPGHPRTVYPNFSGIAFYPNVSGIITLQTRPDFPMSKDWYYMEYNVTDTPAPVTSLPETIVTLPTATSVALSPTSSPEATIPPVAPAA
ncbi:hypothetical protein BG015_004579 [Linnemannia schmuckeri]|uniref:Uncharacterized protein n=1 Tax=Linnemannia schmuckeri TaxID=64567 RepID=A0A9P5RB04_9FUNG|nr:hypothetical protein BG015_004579 [Linnemannia schmuckeri]